MKYRELEKIKSLYKEKTLEAIKEIVITELQLTDLEKEIYLRTLREK